MSTRVRPTWGKQFLSREPLNQSSCSSHGWSSSLLPGMTASAAPPARQAGDRFRYHSQLARGPPLPPGSTRGAALDKLIWTGRCHAASALERIWCGLEPMAAVSSGVATQRTPSRPARFRLTNSRGGVGSAIRVTIVLTDHLLDPRKLGVGL
jgi:hypothetical protein